MRSRGGGIEDPGVFLRRFEAQVVWGGLEMAAVEAAQRGAQRAEGSQGPEGAEGAEGAEGKSWWGSMSDTVASWVEDPNPHPTLLILIPHPQLPTPEHP